jgi:arylsulfatase
MKILLFLGILLATSWPGVAAPRPNIIFILTDDQGYGDISAHGNPVLQTPHLDRLRGESVRFTNFFVSPTCAPTRSALLTGRHEFRNGVTHTILERERLALSAMTLPQGLQTAGYATGIFGKWHLGDEPEYQPGRRGFDEVFVHGGGGIGQTYPGSCGDAPGNTYFDPAILHNGQFVKTKGYCTDVFFEQATQWISRRKDSGPFFCWLATNAPHSPYKAKPEDRAWYEGKGLGPDTENFFGMIHNIDGNVGRLLAKLDAWGIARDTLLVMMNDNGGTAGVKVFNAGMRGSKVTPWLGGTRAFSFWRWPGKFSPADCGALTAHVDFFRTIATLTGTKLPALAETQVEGRDLVPLLENPAAPWPDRTLVTHTGRWAKGAAPDTAKFRNCAIRDSRYTLVSERGGEKPAWQLFDVTADPGQTRDLAMEAPAEVTRLSAAYDAWWQSIQPQLVNESAHGPAVNPFKEHYWKQFGGGPSSEDLRLMAPERIEELNGARRPAARKNPAQ